MTSERRRRVCGCLAATLLVACGGNPAGEPDRETASGGVAAATAATAERARDAESAAAAGAAREAAGPVFGAGFVVWESNRGGAWRIWARELAGGEPRRLTPDEPGRDHCCPHISPDGAGVAYLSSPAGRREYPEQGSLGRLHLIAPDGSGDRVAAPAARSYFENRAVVWRSPGELIHIDGDGATVALDLASGAARRLAEPPGETGWLIDPTLSWATGGRPQFSPYDRGRRAVAPRRRLGGCQPYFSRDGRWGYWTSGAGGPIDRIRLADGTIETILEKNDPRVPGGFGYAYFPMSSADGRLFAWAASQGGHDHFTSDYEVFVAESDPDTLELLGPPLRITRHPGVDRFPDAWQPPLELGRHAGEAPLTVELSVPGGGWSWRLGDGADATGGRVEHRWESPGRYEVVATRGGETRRGLVVARPPRPPRPLGATARAGGVELLVSFDEPVDAGQARLELTSGISIVGVEPTDDSRGLLVRLAEPLGRADRLRLSGVRDRAQVPNEMASATLEVEPPAWPASRDGLVFVWETAAAANLVPDPELGADRAYTLAARGRARLDAAFAMRLDGGSFVLAPGEAATPRKAIQASNQLTLEATLESAGTDGQIVTWAGDRAINMWLEQRGGRLWLGLRTGARGPDAYPKVDLGEPPAGRPVHLVAAYRPGRLTAYLDGRRVVDTGEPQGGVYHWRDVPLAFGGDGWRGRLEGVAIYDRVLAPEEAAEAYRLARARLEARVPPPRTVVEARLVALSRTPSLAEISPYREALFAVEYEVERTLEGPPPPGRLRAVQWAVLDGTAEPVSRAAPGDRFRLVLEPFADQPQLESVYLADTLVAGGGGEPLYVVEAAPAG